MGRETILCRQPKQEVKSGPDRLKLFRLIRLLIIGEATIQSRLISNMTMILLVAGMALGERALPVTDAVDKGHAIGHERNGVNAVLAAIHKGGDVNERDESGWTPLMHAALECRPRIVTVLLDHGAEVNLRGRGEDDKFSNSGQTALLLAAGCFIARRRAELASKRKMPADYVHYEMSAPAKMVAVLLAHHADISMTDAEGRTALMLATMHSWPQVVEELVQAHAAVNVRDHEGRLAIDYADPEEKRVVSLLKNAGSLSATGHSGRVVCDAERALRHLGFEQPIEDCIQGLRLSATLRQFQQRHGIQPTGALDVSTLVALGVRQ